MKLTIKKFFLLAMVTLPIAVLAQVNFKNNAVNLPLSLNQTPPSINQIQDNSLQKILEKEINANANWKKLATTKKMAIGIVDLSDTTNFKYAGINDNHMIYAASLPKIAILLAAMDAIDKGELKYTNQIKNDLRLMISKSNNESSTKMIDLLGYKKIESVLRAPQYKFYDEQSGGGLWVGKRYAAFGLRYPEPLKGLSHAATTRQVCNFYYKLATGSLINKERSQQMLEIMQNPELHHKFVNTLDKIAPEAEVYRKSGSWKNYHSDSALVWGPDRKYIIVALVEYADGENTIRELVQPIERAIKKSHLL